MRFRSAIVIFAGVILAVDFIPLRRTVAPEWTVTTLDSHHKPLSGITVREIWQQYSIEDSNHEEDRLTDSKGEVQFPRRTYRTSLAVRFLGCARRALLAGVHASCGPRSYLIAFGNGIDTMDWTDIGQGTGTTMPWQRSTLILKH